MSLLGRIRNAFGGGREHPPATLAPAPVGGSVDLAETFSQPRDEAQDILADLSLHDSPSAIPDGLDPKLAELFFRLGAPAPLGRLAANAQGVPRERLEAAEACRRIEREITGIAAERCIARYSYPPSSRSKCIRDLGIVLNWCVFCMMIEDIELLERHYLRWLRDVFERLKLPGGCTSVTGAFVVLRAELSEKLEPAHHALLEPYVTCVIVTLSRGQAR